LPLSRSRFEAFVARKTREAAQPLRRLVTVEDRSAHTSLQRIGNPWTREWYGGDFHLAAAPEDRPAISLVFVQSRDGNTGASNPDRLGGGPADKHLIYEGLSRVAADAVMAGAATVAGKDLFFSVWREEIVELRRDLGLPRHPTQIVVSQDGNVDLDGTLLFNVPEVPVIVLAGPACRDRCERTLTRRPWISVVPLASRNLEAAMPRLKRDFGISRISCVGGRATATSLLDAGLVQDLCLTTAARPGGEPGTPFYIGARPPALSLIVRKQEMDVDEPAIFEHFLVRRRQRPDLGDGDAAD